MKYIYVKATNAPESLSSHLKKSFKHRLIKIIPNALIVIGATAITTVSYPMISYQLKNYAWQQKKLTSPVNQTDLNSLQNLAEKNQSNTNPADPATPVNAYTEPEVVEEIDYTKAQNWFTTDDYDNNNYQSLSSQVSSYTISIPTLNIDNMTVKVGGDDLDKHLIHYPGTALPGELGNPVIFGHSVLPIFYNPTSYVSIFSKLPTLDEDDEIFIHIDGITYRYTVSSYHEVEPNQIELLEQRYDRRTLTLVTCVPPGTYLRRGVILAQLDPYYGNQ